LQSFNLLFHERTAVPDEMRSSFDVERLRGDVAIDPSMAVNTQLDPILLVAKTVAVDTTHQPSVTPAPIDAVDPENDAETRVSTFGRGVAIRPMARAFWPDCDPMATPTPLV